MNSQITKADWAYTYFLISELPAHFDSIRYQLDELEAQLAGLQNISCTGKVSWRDSNNSGKAPKLYVIHGMNVSCPLHGMPDKGTRIRSYVGSNADKITAAKRAIQFNDTRLAAQREYDSLHQRAASARHRIIYIYHTLGLRAPEQPIAQAGRDDPVIPKE